MVIWEISEMLGYLRNFPNARVSAKFPKCFDILEISQMPRYLINFPSTWVFGKFPNAWVSEKFHKYLVI